MENTPPPPLCYMRVQPPIPGQIQSKEELVANQRAMENNKKVNLTLGYSEHGRLTDSDDEFWSSDDEAPSSGDTHKELVDE